MAADEPRPVHDFYINIKSPRVRGRVTVCSEDGTVLEGAPERVVATDGNQTPLGSGARKFLE